MTERASEPADLTSSQLSWLRTELSDVRTLLAWVRTSVSMIGFGFTIYNFYKGFFDELGSPRLDDAARNLGLSLVGFGTLAMVIALWNFWGIKTYLDSMSGQLQIPAALQKRWVVSYVAAAMIMVIGLLTFIFMVRAI